jgi:glycosyltransferase involved in cell wall biosynthesis
LKTKILHIIDSFGIGGAEKLLVTVINNLDPEKYEQHLILLNRPDTLVSQLPATCSVITLDFRSYKDLVRTRKRVRRYIKEQEIDIVHSQLYWSNIISRMAARKKIPVFNTIQAISSEASYKINRKSLYIEKLTYRKRHHIICVSAEVLHDFDKWVGIKGPSTILYNVIDDKFFAPSPKKDFSSTGLKLVAVGNLRWQKNYPYLLEAFENMPEGVSLDIYGEGELRSEFQKIIEAHKLPVRLCGQRNNLHEILPQYDVFVMSSLYEGFSLGLMEAMASGLPALLSDVPVLKEAGGDSVMYFGLENTDDFIQKISDILVNRSALAVWAEKAWKRAASIAKKEQYMEKLTGLYEASITK